MDESIVSKSDKHTDILLLFLNISISVSKRESSTQKGLDSQCFTAPSETEVEQHKSVTEEYVEQQHGKCKQILGPVRRCSLCCVAPHAASLQITNLFGQRHQRLPGCQRSNTSKQKRGHMAIYCYILYGSINWFPYHVCIMGQGQ